MKRIIIPILLISVLFLYGCSSSGSGGNDAPAGNYSGAYYVTRSPDDIPLGESVFGRLQISQIGSSVAMTYIRDEYWIIITEREEEETEIVSTVPGFETFVELSNILVGIGLGDVHGRRMDITWANGDLTRLSFAPDGRSFNAWGDVSFGGTKNDNWSDIGGL